MTLKKDTISPELEKVIVEYEKHLFNPVQTPYPKKLEQEVFKYIDTYNFNQHGDSGSQIDVLSSRFAKIWDRYYYSGKYFEADRFWDLLLGLYDKWENANNNTHVASGTPCYCRGMSAIAYRNIPRGFLFFHRAMEDDFLEGYRPEQKVYPSPAWAFVTFNYSDPRQTARPLLKPRTDWLNGILSKYQSSNRGSLSLEKMREKVLVIEQLWEATFSFTYEVFRSQDLLSYPEKYRTGRFASQLMLDILFSLCRIAEVWLKEKQPPVNSHETQLGGQLVRFFRENGSSITKLSESEAVDFEKTLTSLLENKANNQLWESDLLLIHKLRNEAGHAATSSSVITERFNELLERVFFGLFRIVETLYL